MCVGGIKRCLIASTTEEWTVHFIPTTHPIPSHFYPIHPIPPVLFGGGRKKGKGKESRKRGAGRRAVRT